MVDEVGRHGGDGAKGKGGGLDKALAEDRGGTPEGRGEFQSPGAVGGRVRTSVFFDSATYSKRGGGRGSAGSELSECVEACRAAATSSLAPTVAALYFLFRDVLCLLQSGLVRTFLSEGGGTGTWRAA